jgi:gas vesicle protein
MNQHIPQGPMGTGSQSTNEPQSSSTTESLKQSASQAKDNLKSKVNQLKLQAAEKGEQTAAQAKSTAADKIEGVSKTLRQTTERLQQEQDPNIAHYTQMVADKLEHAASYVRQCSVNDLKTDAESMARRHPAVFFGGMFLVGLAASRFFKASMEPRETEHETSFEETSEDEYLESTGEDIAASAMEPEYPSHPIPTL